MDYKVPCGDKCDPIMIYVPPKNISVVGHEIMVAGMLKFYHPDDRIEFSVVNQDWKELEFILSDSEKRPVIDYLNKLRLIAANENYEFDKDFDISKLSPLLLCDLDDILMSAKALRLEWLIRFFSKNFNIKLKIYIEQSCNSSSYSLTVKMMVVPKSSASSNLSNEFEFVYLTRGDMVDVEFKKALTLV